MSSNGQPFCMLLSVKTTYSLLSFPQLPIYFCVVVRLLMIFFFQFATFIDVTLAKLTCWQSRWWDLMNIASDIIMRHSLTANFLILWLFQSFLPILLQCLLSLSLGEVLGMYLLELGSSLPWCDSLLSSIILLCSKKEDSLMRDEEHDII